MEETRKTEEVSDVSKHAGIESNKNVAPPPSYRGIKFLLVVVILLQVLALQRTWNRGMSSSGSELAGIQSVVSLISKRQDNMLNAMGKGAGPARTGLEATQSQAAAALRALEMGKEAEQSGEIESAMLYYLNGVNHDPGNLELIGAVAACGEASNNDQLLTRAQTVLELALYQVPAEDVQRVLGYLNNIEKKVNNFYAEDTPTKGSLQDRYEELKQKYNPDIVCRNPQSIPDGVGAIEGLLEDIRAIEPSGKMVPELLTLLERLRNIQDVAAVSMHVANALAKLEAQAAMESPSPALSGYYHTAADLTYVQLCGAKLSGLPIVMQKEIEGYADRIKNARKAIAKKTQKSDFEKVSRTLASLLEKRGDTNTEVIKHIENELNILSRSSSTIDDPDYQKSLNTQYETVRDKLQQWHKKRYAAYQEWALTQCQMAYSLYASNRVFTDDDADAIFKRCSIATIDHQLLIPEVKRLFDCVLQIILGEVSGSKSFKFDKEMAKSPKMKLEDF